MSLATARRDIESRLDTNWATTRVAYDNIEFSEPAGNESWVQCEIFEESATRLNIGNPGCHRVTGLIMLSVMVPKDTGTKTARAYADSLAEIFRDRQFGGITCQEAIPQNAGLYSPPLARRGSGWYRYNISIRFYWDGVYDVS